MLYVPDTVALPPFTDDANPEFAWKYSTKISVEAYWFAGLDRLSFVFEAEALTATFPLMQIALPPAELERTGKEKPFELVKKLNPETGVAATPADRPKSPAASGIKEYIAMEI